MSDIRNSNGIWINSNLFIEDALHFKKYGYYCTDPWGSSAWYEYWKEQKRRAIYGFEIGGAKITGDHYFYLNFCPINKSEDTKSKRSKKILDFPDFWDGDYDYFWARDIAKNGILDSLRVEEKEIDRINLLAPDEKIVELVKYYDSLGLYNRIRPYALEGGHNLIVGKSRRKGYQQPHSEIVMTPNGPSTMGEVQIGDEVLTPNGRTKILEKYFQGICDVYEITLQDGRKVRCGLEHLWNIQEFRGYKKTVDTKFFLNKKLKRGTKGKEYYSYFVPQTEAVNYNNNPVLPINPYILGLLIGDGSINRSTCLFSTEDKELLTYIKDILGEDYSIKYKVGCQYGISYNKDHTNPLMHKLKNLGLREVAKHKFIPDIYKYSSIEDRYELVRGLMDTDGSTWKNGSCNFINTSEKLIDDLQFVLRSLGIRVKKSICNNLNKGFAKNQTWVLIITTDKPIFKLKRKLDKIRSRQYNINKIAITNVEKLNYQEESSCILIDSEEHLYLTRDFIVTHNSFKNAAIGVKNYFTIPNSLTIYSAYEKKYLYPKGIFTMAGNYINFINDNTAWIMPSDYVDRTDHRRASYKEYRNGVQIEKGFKSELMALTFKDNPDVTRGKDAVDLLIEESGAFGTPGLLKDCYAASEDTVKDGEIKTGLITLFGTSGDMEGGTADYAEMFMNPERFGLLPFEDVWEDEVKFKGGTTGFFHPAQLNLPGTYDNQGNSDFEKGKEIILKERILRASKGATSTDIAKLSQEKPLKPREAFAYSSFNIFPTFELQKRLDIMKIRGWDKLRGQPVTIYRDSDTQKVTTEPDMKNVLQPIREYKFKGPDLGAVVIYEQPIPNTPRGLYKIGYDPVRQDTGTSLSAIIVYKGYSKDSNTKNKVVAEYIGRTETPDDAHYIAELLAELYNTQVMYENEVPDVKTYFLRRKKLHLLALQPDGVIKKNVKHSTVNRVYGCHMNGPLKDAAEKYTKEWLLQIDDYDETEQPIRTLDKIDSTRLLEELIMYERKGNYDLLSALFMCLIQLNEEYLDKDYKESVAERNAKKLIESMNMTKTLI